MKLIIGVYLALVLSLSAEDIKKEDVRLKPGAEVNNDFSFLPEVVARYGDEQMFAGQLLFLMKAQLSVFAGRFITQLELKQMAAHFIISHYEHKAALAIAARYGLVPSFGLADLQFKRMEETLGKVAVMERFASLGLKYSQLSAYFAEQETIKEWYEKEVVSRADVGEIEAIVFYQENKEKFTEAEQIRFAEIFIGFVGDEKRKEAKGKIDEIIRQLDSGSAFKGLAKMNSEAQSAAAGGELKVFVAKKDLLSEFQLLFKMKENQISTVVETATGFYLFRLLQKKSAYTPEFSEVKEELLKRLVHEKAQAMKALIIRKYMQGQHFEVFIK
ncbi:MAG: peptidylprolyl isomerase [Lentisphaeraceae bacterium]|nr:peptidylprolyl isomerase [Lentisphaeraceae bacterium]